MAVDLYRVIDLLRAEVDRLDAAIVSLEAMMPLQGQSLFRVHGPGRPRGSRDSKKRKSRAAAAGELHDSQS